MEDCAGEEIADPGFVLEVPMLMCKSIWVAEGRFRWFSHVPTIQDVEVRTYYFSYVYCLLLLVPYFVRSDEFLMLFETSAILVGSPRVGMAVSDRPSWQP